MINHIVLFKLKEYETEDLKALTRSKIKNALLALKDKISEIKYLEVGENHELKTNSFDICLITHFDSLEDLEIYRIHPEHLKVVDLIQANAASKAAVDYEL